MEPVSDESGQVGPPAVLEPHLVTAVPDAPRPSLHDSDLIATPRRTHARLGQFIVLVGDVLLVLAAVVLLSTNPAHVALVVLITVLTLGVQRAYRRKLTLSVLDDLVKFAFAAAAGAFLGGVITHRHDELLSAVVVASAVFVGLTVGRIITYGVLRWLRRRGTMAARTLVIGGGTIGARLVGNAQAHHELGLLPVGIVDANPVPETQTLDVCLVSPARPLADVISTMRVDTVVVAFSEVNELELLDTLRTCDRLGCELLVVPRLFEIASLTDDMQLVRDVPLTHVRRAPYRNLEWRFKRLFDIAFSACALLLLSPLLAILALAVWLSDRRAPIFYRQVRVGLDGKQFNVLKFRTLKPVDEVERPARWSAYDGDRIGPVGKVLRSTSLDELPQFWNVLSGDMSVVGPRPERPHFAAEFQEAMRHYGARHRVPAGLTGWAAVHGLRGDTSVRERAAYDNFYIENWSLWLDCKIILRTILSVLRRSGG